MEVIKHHSGSGEKSSHKQWVSLDAKNLHRMGRHLGQGMYFNCNTFVFNQFVKVYFILSFFSAHES